MSGLGQVPEIEARDLALGLAVVGARSMRAGGRLVLWPARLTARAPLVGDVLRRRAEDGMLARARARAALEAVAADVLAAPEVERAVARALARIDLDRIVVAVLDHERTQELVERVLASPGLERLVVSVIESRLVDELTEQVLASPELDRVVEYVATSPRVMDAVGAQTRTLADELASTVRRRAGSADDVAERTVRGWLRRPRPT